MSDEIISGEDIKLVGERPPKLNSNVKEVASIGDYSIYLHSNEEEYEIYAHDYHPGNLILTKTGLEKLLAILRNKE